MIHIGIAIASLGAMVALSRTPRSKHLSVSFLACGLIIAHMGSMLWLIVYGLTWATGLRPLPWWICYTVAVIALTLKIGSWVVKRFRERSSDGVDAD